MVERSDSFIYQAFFADSGDQEGYDAVNRFGVKLPRSGFVRHQNRGNQVSGDTFYDISFLADFQMSLEHRQSATITNVTAPLIHEYLHYF